MGICTSHQRNTVATAKLVHEDGHLEEFPSPITVSQILQRNPTNNFFICDADDLSWDEFIPPIDDEDELQLGHLYLELPFIRLHSPVTPEEIAALAVKASLVLQNPDNNDRNRSCWFPIRNLSFLDYFKSDKSEEVFEATTPLVQIAREIVRRKQGGDSGGGGGGEQKKFISKLSVSLEGKEIIDIRN